MRFRPCIDLHRGRVKQIVGSSWRDGQEPQTNFSSEASAAEYAARYRRDGLVGGHLIMLGPGNEQAAAAALAAFPGGLQIGGGITAENAPAWLARGASHAILTSYLFTEGKLRRDRLEGATAAVGRARLVLDLSCARRGGRYVVMTDRWQRPTELVVEARTLAELAPYCAEFLVHATQVEGLRQGIDTELVRLLADAAPLPTTYAGGVRSMDDIEAIRRLGQDRLDYTVGSALDIFGGTGVRYADLVAQQPPAAPGGAGQPANR